MHSLLEQFLSEEADPHIRKLIADAINGHHLHPEVAQRRFEFNRFEVTLDFENGTVLIEDDWEARTCGEVRFTLDEFLGQLNSR